MQNRDRLPTRYRHLWIGAGASFALAFSVVAHAKKAPSLFYLTLAGEVVQSDGENHKVLAKSPVSGPDGIAIDKKHGHIYWTTMGKVRDNDGAIVRSNMDGSNVVIVVPVGATFTPKQLKIDDEHGKLYWSDREGMRVMRANLDGSQIETLVITGSTEADRADQSRWCVGIAVDVKGGKIYWSQKGGDNANQGTIKRANINLKAGEDPAHRSDIEVLFANLPEPIDLDLDLQTKQIYWTDRGDNTVSRAPMNPPSGFDPAKRNDRQILVKGMHEAIGIALDLHAQRLYYTSLAGELGTAKLDGSDAKMLPAFAGKFTGIALSE